MPPEEPAKRRNRIVKALTVETDQPSEPKAITFAEFLESIGSSQAVRVVQLWERNKNGYGGTLQDELQKPELLLHCPSDTCNGNRIFRYERGTTVFSSDEKQNLSTFLTYLCSNCRRTRKLYSLHITREVDWGGIAYKYGELPTFGPQTPTRLLRLFGKDRDTFLKGRQCEIHGLGIGAFVYYRRVVESHKDQIFDEIIKVAQKVGAAPDTIDALVEAKKEVQFSKGVKGVRVAIPESLLVDGHNPLTMLHSALSRGVHELTDQQCLQLAHDVRLVLSDLAERISQALADQAELKTAVSRLLDTNREN